VKNIKPVDKLEIAPTIASVKVSTSAEATYIVHGLEAPISQSALYTNEWVKNLRTAEQVTEKI
jgi:hypothetical protein